MDKKEIVKVLKEEGLDITEEAAVAAVRGTIRLLGILLPKISNGLGAIAAPLLVYAEPLILAQIDKIDGEDDEGY